MPIIKKRWGRQKPPLGTWHNFSHPLSHGLVGHWIMNESGGRRAYDISGKGNHGTLTDSSPALLGPAWTQGRFGPALSFDGTDDIVNAGSPTALQTPGNKTFSARIKVTTFQVSAWDYAGIAVFGKTADNIYGIGLKQENPGTSGDQKIPVLEVQYSTGDWINVTGSALSLATWYHIAGVVTGTNLYLYVDGVQTTTAWTGTPKTGDSTYTLAIGRDWYDNNATRFFNGLIDDVRIYNRALSVEEVRSLYLDPFADMVQPRIWLPEAAEVDTPITPPQGSAVLTGAAGRMDLGIFVPTAV